jgi:hypothetical protein
MSTSLTGEMATPTARTRNDRTLRYQIATVRDIVSHVTADGRHPGHAA